MAEQTPQQHRYKLSINFQTPPSILPQGKHLVTHINTNSRNYKEKSQSTVICPFGIQTNVGYYRDSAEIPENNGTVLERSRTVRDVCPRWPKDLLVFFIIGTIKYDSLGSLNRKNSYNLMSLPADEEFLANEDWTKPYLRV